MSYQGQMTQVATIERNSPTRSAAGEVSPAWGSVGTARCTVRPRRGALTRTEAGVTFEADFMGYFPAGTDLRPETSADDGDRILVDSIYYRVVFVMDLAAKGRVLAAYLKREG